ncbi:PAS domain S-box protein [bacterium]|nr:PAS domain S-box protein [bacterium]
MPNDKIDRESLVSDFQEYLSKIEHMFVRNAEELDDTERRFQTVIEQAANAIIILDTNLNVVTWNDGAEFVFGYSASEALGKKIDELVACESGGCLILLKKILSGQKIRSLEAVRLGKDGNPKNVIISGTPVRNQQGVITSLCLIYNDITALKGAQDDLLQSEKQATLGVIAGSIGHEQNNLVGALMMHAHLLREDPEDLEQVQLTADMFCEYLVTISMHAKNLLSLSKPVQPQIQEIDLVDVLDATTETLRLSGILKRCLIIKKYDKNLPPIRADRHLLEQVIRNLEINAAHAMGDGGTLTLHAKLNETADFVELRVQDNGHGIPEAIQQKVFDKFFTTKSDGKGTGLGLPIVMQIIEQLKGYLKLDSQENVGTCFIVGIPVGKS